MLPPPPSSPLFPYTTLFRSPPPAVDRRRPAARGHGRGAGRDGRDALTRRAAHAGGGHGPVVRSRNPTAFAVQRSTTSGGSPLTSAAPSCSTPNVRYQTPTRRKVSAS